MNSEISTSRWAYAIGPVGAGIRQPDEKLTYHFNHFLDDALRATNYVQELNPKLVASWVLARLRRLAPESIPERWTEHSDGYSFDIAVRNSDGTVVANCQLQGDPMGVVMLGGIRDQTMADEICNDLVSVLCVSPAQLGLCHYQVIDPEWEFDRDSYDARPNSDTRNNYGWDGTSLHGADNTVELQ